VRVLIWKYFGVFPCQNGVLVATVKRVPFHSKSPVSSDKGLSLWLPQANMLESILAPGRVQLPPERLGAVT